MRVKGDVKKKLVSSFKALAVKTPVEKITIQEITQGAGVIRPTFYHHFQDKYQLLESIFKTEIMDPVRELIHNDMLAEAVTLVFVQMSRDKEFYSKVSRLTGQNSFEAVVKDSIYETMMDMIETKSSGKVSKYKLLSHEMLARYYAEFLGFIVLTWIKEGMNATPQEMAVLFNYIRNHSLYDIIRDME